MHVVKWLNNSVWSTDGTSTDTAIPGQSEPGSYAHERVLHIDQSSKTGASSSDGLVS